MAKKPYHWFEGASVKALREQLNEAGDGAVFEVHQSGKKMTLRVVSPEYNGPLINESHVCPPQCPK